MDKTKQKDKLKPKHHKLRSFFSSIFGIAAVFFIISSITVVWLNRTLIDNQTYVSTVSPLVSKPTVQNLIADKLSNQLIYESPINNVAQALLPASDLNGSNTPAQLKSLVKPIIETDIISILNSNNFQTLWTNTNKQAQSQFISGLKSSSNSLSLNLHPAIVGIITELKSSQLSSAANHVNVSPTAGILDIKANRVSKIRSYYKFFQLGTIAFVLIAIVSLGLSVWIAINHWKVLRRLLLISGIFVLLGAAILKIPSHVNLVKNNLITSDGIKTIFATLTHNLFISDLVIGIAFIVIVIAWDIINYFVRRKKNDKQLAKTIDNS